MWVSALADRVTLEEEYLVWVVFSHLLTPIPCIITRNLFLLEVDNLFRKKIVMVSPFIYLSK